MADDGDIPDLLPAGRVRPGPARPEPGRPEPRSEQAQSTAGRSEQPPPWQPVIQVAVESPPDPDDLEFDIVSARGTELPWDSPFRPSEAPELAPAVRPAPAAPAPAQSVRPAAAPSFHPAANPSLRPGPPALDLGLDGGTWDLEDELADPRAAQLNVAVAMPATADVPWPRCRTPLPEDLNFTEGDVAQTLGVPRPAGFLQAPAYYWSGRRALGRLSREIQQAASRLAEAEAVRDALLAEVATGARSALQGTDRFRSAYDGVDQQLRIVRDARAALVGADTQGESGLSQLDVELETAKATAALRTRDAAERRALSAGGERDLARLRAAVQRHGIERRNIVARAQETSAPGAEMPPELAGRFLAVEEQIKRGDAELAAYQEAQKKLDALLRVAEDEERRALAHVRQVEAKREGLILSQQGTLGDLNETLERAETGLTATLADVGRGIVELRGEIPIADETRTRLLESDPIVSSCALELERRRRASESIDAAAYQQGRNLFIAAGVLLVVLLAWLLSR